MFANSCPCDRNIIIEQRYIRNMEKKETRTVKLKTKLIFIYLIIFGFRFSQAVNHTYEEIGDAVFQVPEFSYEQDNKNEAVYRKFETSCEQSAGCETLKGLEKTKCTRQCISPSCYHQLYDFDELEEREVDVRLNSFKGCFIQEYRAQNT